MPNKNNKTSATPAELLARKYLAEHGFHVEIIEPSNTPKNRNPDFLIDGKIWELKTPTTNNKQTIARKIRKGSRQAENLIIDLRFVKMANSSAINILNFHFHRSRRIKRMMIIDKTGHLLTLQKK